MVPVGFGRSSVSVEERVVALGRLSSEVFDAVIFDMDGTLIDSVPAVERSWGIWAAEYGLDVDTIRRFHGVPAAGIVELLIPKDRQQIAIDRINELEVADVEGIVVLPGAAEALAAVKGAKNAIATSCTADLAKARIAATALQVPTVLVTADDVSRGKPDPEPFLTAAERLGVDPKRCLAVEDAPAGVAAARAAGCFSLGVLTTTPAEQMPADALVPDLSAVRFEVVEGGGIRIREA
jgi:sugar-phosphatase